MWSLRFSCNPAATWPQTQGQIAAAHHTSRRVLVLPRRCHRPVTTALSVSCSAAATAEQLTQVAARLSSVRSRELLAASCVELLKAALVGSATPPADGGSRSGEDSGGKTPEALLDALHASLQDSLQDAAHTVAPEHQEAWGESQWEAFQEAHVVVQQLLWGLHLQAARAGSATGALQVARCLEHGLLVPQDPAAAFRKFKEAAAQGSAEGCLRCGIHYFEGSAPGGRDGARAYGFFSQALDFADTAIRASSSASSVNDESPTPLPPLAPPSADTAVEGDVPALLTDEEVRFSALTWMGRCYMEGAGVERSIAQAAKCFQQAGNAAELRELLALKQMFAEADIGSADTS